MTSRLFEAVFVTAPSLVAAALLFWVPPVPPARLTTIAEPADEKRPGLWADRSRALALAAVCATVVLWALAGAVPTAAVLVVVAGVATVSLRSAARRAEAAIRHAVYELCCAVAAELRAGSTPAAAFRSGVAVAPEPLRTKLQWASDVVGAAEPAEFADVLSGIASTRRSLLGLARLAACWRVVVASGAMLAPAIDRVGDALRDDIDLERELATALAAPRATVRLLAALPLLGLGLGVVIGAHPVAFLLGSPGGLCCLLVAAAFDGAGVVWAWRIASRAVGFCSAR